MECKCVESLQLETATTADACFAVQAVHDILRKKNAEFVNYFSTNVIVAIVETLSATRKYLMTMNTIVTCVGRCVKAVLETNSSAGLVNHIAKYVEMECITVELTIPHTRVGDIMAKCYIYGCHNQAPKDCWSGRCALHCTNVHCERYPKDEEDLPEPDNTDYLGEDSDCISSYSDEECGAKMVRLYMENITQYNAKFAT